MADKRRSFYGWGYQEDAVSAEELGWFERAWADLFGVDQFDPVPMPREGEIELRAPRVAIPKSLAAFCSDDKYDRLLHSYGHSPHDLARMIHRRDFSNPPDVVAHVRDEADIQAVLDWCGANDLAAVPYGGGSSVVGGVNPPTDERYKGTVTIDLGRLNKVLEIDAASQAARVQTGVLGPDLESQLRPSGLTMRFFLQAWEFSSLGGWIATRAAGHFATVYTQIDDHVESLRVVTPSGLIASRRVPASGAGPNPDRLFLGSEGALGIITEAWVRLHRRPTIRLATTVRFTDYEQACDAVRAITQSGLYPANARLIERDEAAFTEAGDGSADVLVLTFESADHPLEPWMDRALEICGDHGGAWDTEALGQADSQRSGAAGNWRNKFLRGPYLREHAIARGVMRDTVESCITWDRYLDFQDQVKRRTLAAIREVTGREGTCTVRFTHLYPDGPAPYFTWHALGDKERLVEQFWAIKAAASQAMIDAGGTITHHHALGRDHREWYDQERPELFAEGIKAIKGRLDPQAVLNPGILVDP
ncbi:MAG: FAD-binding oxidoreductase [Alphaproteobacteria bacterium]|jgi:alkyldihydroxyacetonephosphate synthase|nr:FAD-binding oxidoreductase [Alphaproteobacteria bacterium]MDP6812125.1 FAD-binding oxidoreductase [Alphaproteobacteria bacterium]